VEVSDTTQVSPVEEGTHIRFIPAPPKPKTLVWYVVNRYEDSHLGRIKWFGRWRKYSFFPKPECVFEEVCLREIADFCERKTREHREANKAQRKRGL